MTGVELEYIREKWKNEKEAYKEFGKTVLEEVKKLFEDNEINAYYSYRVKEDDSLLKKALFKNKKYENIFDKVGARAVVQFLSNLYLCDKLVVEHFANQILKRDDKIETAKENEFGYLSIHYEIADKNYDSNGLICEFQLRTICQNTWADISHALTYKPGIDLPVPIKREVNALSALLEIADNQFEKISAMISNLPVDNPVKILSFLSNFFYTNISGWHDSEMSYYFLADISKLYGKDEAIIDILREYIRIKGNKISDVAKKRKDIPFFTQPEIVVILERLENKKFLLQDYWVELYEIDDLERIANAWGTTLQ